MQTEQKPRQLVALVGEENWLAEHTATLFLPTKQGAPTKSAVFFSAQFSAQDLPTALQHWAAECQFFSLNKSANALGQEWDLIIVDARFELHLETLAIASGALKAGGLLLLWLQHWQDLGSYPDRDSLRWSGKNQPITSPNFIQYFQQCFTEAKFACYQQSQHQTPVFTLRPCSNPSQFEQLNLDQQKIAQQILTQPAQINLLTAKRGRGKSALAGWLANQLAQTTTVWVTAPNSAALTSLRNAAKNPIQFIAPDALLERIQQDEDFSQDWLLVDEAASIPLPILQEFSQHFAHLLLTSTTQSYEGTGQGLLLKFVKHWQKNQNIFSHFQLHQPLRWAQNDPLERFIEKLLLLETPAETVDFNLAALKKQSLQPISQQVLFTRQRFQQFYALLALAHYRTTPLDLRRLFDAPNQYLYAIEQDNQQAACLWTLSEGCTQDEDLIEKIWRGERRPKGNLVAQTLCFQAGLKQACRLRSLRISRFALAPILQNQGFGQHWLKQWLADLSSEDWDYISVSFGYQPDLAHFWQKCGFQFVHIGEHQEASSGCYSAIAIYPISQAGNDFCLQAQTSFQRHIGLSFHQQAHCFSSLEDWSFNVQDRQALIGFAFAQRSLASTIPALRRYLTQSQNMDCPKLNAYLTQRKMAQHTTEKNKKCWLQDCRLELQCALNIEKWYIGQNSG